MGAERIAQGGVGMNTFLPKGFLRFLKELITQRRSFCIMSLFGHRVKPMNLLSE